MRGAKEKTFRDDLYYRLKVVSMTLPPLRQRLSDINDLVAHFIQKSSRELGIQKITLQEGCMGMLKRHPSRGNVRELENIITSASVQSRGSVILLDVLEDLLSHQPIAIQENNSACSLAQAESRHIHTILKSVQEKWG